MKKIYVACTIITSFSARAQYTITAASSPVVGDVYQYYTMDSTGVTSGTSGTAQVWDYTNLIVDSPNRITETYTTAASTPSASLFPAATIAVQNSDAPGYCAYFNYSTTKKELVGVMNSDPTVGRIQYADPQTLMEMPFGYGSSPVTDQFAGSYTVASTPVNFTGTMTIAAEGTGTLKLPNGQTYSNTLKVKEIEYNVQTFGPNTFIIKTITYSWYSAVNKFPLLEIVFSTQDDGTDIYSDKSVSMNNIAYVGVKENGITENKFSVYPNPAKQEMFISVEMIKDKSYTATIMDPMGKTVRQIEVNNTPGVHRERIDLSGLSAGLYFIKLSGSHTESIQKLIVE